jgi:lysine-N-methylase
MEALRIPLKLVMQPGFQQYDCTGCGECCRGRFAIVINKDDRDRIVDQHWSDEDLGLAGKPLFTPHGDDFQLAHHADSSCAFLQEDGRCRIHAVHGEAAKPLACRMFPFQFVPLGNQVRVDVRFNCAATSANLGRPITEHRADLLELLKTAVPAERAADMPVPPLHGSVQLTWEQLSRITKTFERVLLDVSLNITVRLTACVDLVELLREAPPEAFNGKALSEYLDEAAYIVTENALGDPLVADTRAPTPTASLKGRESGGSQAGKVAPSNTHLAAFRQVLAIYGCVDKVGVKARLWQRLTLQLRMLAGKGNVPTLQEGFPKVRFAGIENGRGIPSGDTALALERYLHVHLMAMGFFGPSFYNRSYLDGMSSLLFTYPLICWFARAYAASDGLPEINRSCVERALMIVDHQHGIASALDSPSERYRTNFLCERAVLRSLIIWYGS